MGYVTTLECVLRVWYVKCRCSYVRRHWCVPDHLVMEHSAKKGELPWGSTAVSRLDCTLHTAGHHVIIRGIGMADSHVACRCMCCQKSHEAPHFQYRTHMIEAVCSEQSGLNRATAVSQ